MTNYHNLRDSNGRFTHKTTTAPKAKKSTKKEKTTNSTKPKTTTILNGFLLDASGSMASKEKSVVDGFNEIVAQGKIDAAKTGVTNKQFVAFFGSEYKQIEHEIESLISTNAPVGTSYAHGYVTYAANMGMTALWESTYRLITKLENELPRNPNAKIILTIFTDGEENYSSKKWRDGTEIKKLIEQKQAEGWVITFIGAGLQTDMEKIATSVGIFASNAMGYKNTAAGTKGAFNKMSSARSTYTSAVADGLDSNIGFFAND